jgi:hypothetical protein
MKRFSVMGNKAQAKLWVSGCKMNLETTFISQSLLFKARDFANDHGNLQFVDYIKWKFEK